MLGGWSTQNDRDMIRMDPHGRKHLLSLTYGQPRTLGRNRAGLPGGSIESVFSAIALSLGSACGSGQLRRWPRTGRRPSAFHGLLKKAYGYTGALMPEGVWCYGGVNTTWSGRIAEEPCSVRDLGKGLGCSALLELKVPGLP